MQVKKFEAKTMKEALEMVKSQLGPDAIILGARDNNRGFGLLGTTSVEVTAAISENKLREKQFAESRMRAQDKEKFRKATAAFQKQYIDQSVRRVVPTDTGIRRAPTMTQYIDITDEKQKNANSGPRVEELLRKMDQKQTFVEPSGQADAKRRIQDAARSAAEIFKSTVQETAKVSPAPVRTRETPDAEVLQLRQEVEILRRTVGQFGQAHNGGSYPGAEYSLPFDVSFVFEKLVDAGLLKENAAEILHRAQKNLSILQLKNKNLVEAWVANEILNSVSVTDSPEINGVHVFVGNSGQGKTSTLVKFAGQLVVQHRKKVALLTADTFKVGAIDQIKIFSQILNAGFGVIRDRSDWSKYLKEFAAADAILVDMPGLSLKDVSEMETFKALQPPSEVQVAYHFVQSVCAKDVDAIEIARRYAVANCSDVIATHLDESLSHGIIYNFQRATNWPLHSFGVGPRIPDDFEPATRERVLDLIFKISKNDKSERSR